MEQENIKELNEKKIKIGMDLVAIFYDVMGFHQSSPCSCTTLKTFNQFKPTFSIHFTCLMVCLFVFLISISLRLCYLLSLHVQGITELYSPPPPLSLALSLSSTLLALPRPSPTPLPNGSRQETYVNFAVLKQRLSSCRRMIFSGGFFFQA